MSSNLWKPHKSMPHEGMDVTKMWTKFIQSWIWQYFLLRLELVQHNLYPFSMKIITSPLNVKLFLLNTPSMAFKTWVGSLADSASIHKWYSFSNIHQYPITLLQVIEIFMLFCTFVLSTGKFLANSLVAFTGSYKAGGKLYFQIKYFSF